MPILTTLLTTVANQWKPGIYFAERQGIEELVHEYTTTPAPCPLVFACKGSIPEIEAQWNDKEVLKKRGVEYYLPFNAGDIIVATKVTTCQVGTGGDLKFTSIPDFNMAEEKSENKRFGVEVMENKTDEMVWKR